ncbi:MAG: carotenoid 1,2-hydratase, partial [Verrucomicrobiota bacterium]|nr:carotenoid 1,2-hydratase [Verrucomicrobiota bacterium]
YFTGNIDSADGRPFGYELTFFRHGVRPPSDDDANISRFVVGDLKFAHFTITDGAGRRFHFAQKTSRGAFGEAGFDEGDRLAWIDGWTLRSSTEGTAFDLAAETPEMAVKLHLVGEKPPAIHGNDGVSAKAEGEGHSSHYYSITRLTTSGEVRVGETSHAIRGESWFDHEWATNQLAAGQAGWNWISVQFDDGGDLMLYQMRLANGTADPSSSGTWIDAAGGTTYLPATAFAMKPVRYWKSAGSGANYPIAWQVELPGRHLQFTITAVLDEQELALGPLTYWEGAISAKGTRDGKAISGRGYLELTGYAGPLSALQR